MDAERFDSLTRVMASGSTRRRALRLAGGGLAGALLAAVGVGKRAEAQQDKPIFSYCNDGEGGVILNDVDLGDPQNGDALPCGGNADCPGDKICISQVNPTGRIRCRCVEI